MIGKKQRNPLAETVGISRDTLSSRHIDRAEFGVSFHLFDNVASVPAWLDLDEPHIEPNWTHKPYNSVI
jgi:hypothetical protein